MFKFKKVMASIIAAATVIVGVGSMNASAITYMHTNTTTTSGGTGGTVVIRSRVFYNTVQQYAGVYTYEYGAVSDIQTATSLITSFTITGTLYAPDSSTPISASKTANSAKAYVTSTSSSAYEYCASKTVTSSSAYGTSSRECNAAF